MSILYRTILDIPKGKMVALSTGRGLAFLEFVKPDRRALMERRLERRFKGYRIEDGGDEIVNQTRQWLAYYFAGRFDRLTAPPLDMRGTPFELQVWQELKNIPLGQTVTYGELAARLEKPKGARAVGGASRRNPVSLIVPCHRVVGQSGALTGYGGGLDLKEYLIAHERPAR